jgi:FkbM family methyltransferase
LFAKAVGASGKVIAFDPTPSMFAALQANVVLNGFSDRVVCRNVALSDTVGKAMLNCFPEGNEVYNSLGAKQAVERNIPVVSTVEVRVAILDDEIKDLLSAEHEIFIKIDVEGFEHKVLLGAVSSLRKQDGCSLMVELYEPAAQQSGNSILETFQLLKQTGFKPFQATNDGRLEAMDDVSIEQLKNNDRTGLNVFFLKPLVEQRLLTQGVILS